ncbi:unnamed protein product, partial [Prorocentrum cordatum]
VSLRALLAIVPTAHLALFPAGQSPGQGGSGQPSAPSNPFTTPGVASNEEPETEDYKLEDWIEESEATDYYVVSWNAEWQLTADCGEEGVRAVLLSHK